jgi:hypothetical protein
MSQITEGNFRNRIQAQGAYARTEREYRMASVMDARIRALNNSRFNTIQSGL